MFYTFFHSSSQKALALLALSIVLFFNATFFSKVFHYALLEENYFVLLSAPFILWLILVFILNLIFLFAYKMVFKLLIALLIFSSTLASYFIDSFGTVIDVNMYINILQTDSNEVLDLISIKLLVYLFLATLVSAWVLFKANFIFESFSKELLLKAIIALVSFACIAGLYMGISKTYSSFFRNHSELKMYLNPVYPIKSFYKLINQTIKGKPVFQAIALDATRSSETKKKLVVLVVGETARAENFSLNGYNVPTNPLLSEEKNLVFLSNTASCGTATAISLPCMFSKFERTQWSSDKEYYENSVDVLAKTGVRVIWRDNNSGADKGVAKRLKDVVFYGGKEFDDVLLKDFQSNLDKTHEDTFMVLHQEGSHGPTYFKRYPDSFKKFTPTCDTQELNNCSQEQIVNTYNNTILYTDYIINEAIKLLKVNENKYDTTLIYMSDHGESLGENGIYLHGLPYMIAPETQKHIPALVYLGDNQQKAYEHLRKKANERLSHDNLFHTLLGLFNVKTDEYNSKLDFLKL